MSISHRIERVIPPFPDEPKWLKRIWRYSKPPVISHNVRTMLLKRALKAHGPWCCWCGVETRYPENGESSGRKPHHRTLEHLVPRAMGGLDTIENTRIACYACNHERGVQQEWDVWLHRLKTLAPNKLFGSYCVGDEAT